MDGALPTLDTSRLTLRPFVPGDAPRVQALAGDREVARTTITIPHPYPDGAAESWIATHATRWANGKGVQWAICERASGDLVGEVSLLGAIVSGRAELGYWIGVPYWNRGYATEAVRAAVRYGFGELGLRRIVGAHMRTNPASGRVLRKAGLRYEGCLRQHETKWGRAEDVLVYGVLKDDPRA